MKVFSRRQPVLLPELLGPAVIEELVGLVPLRDDVLLRTARNSRSQARQQQNERDDSSRCLHASTGEAVIQRCSAARPSASDVAGVNPRSARASEVSA